MASQAFPPTALEQSILKTLCWFSVTDYPVTGFEIWKWLLEPDRAYDLSEVYQVLASSEWLKDCVAIENGHYMIQLESRHETPLPDPPPRRGGGTNCIANRNENYLDAIRKFKKLRRAVRFFSLFESVSAVAAVNSIAWMNTNAKSDIDLFVVTKPKSIWSTRFWIVAPFIALRKRPGASQDPFCFSFFATSNALAMDHLRLKEGDHYFAFWLKSMVPMFDRDDHFEKLQNENTWADQLLPNASPRTVHPLHCSAFPSAPFVPSAPFEPFFRSIQQKRFPAVIRNLANKDSRVVITDDMLKFHDTDRRAEFQHLYEETVKRLCV